MHRQNIMTSSNGNIFRVTGHSCGESMLTGDFPSQRPVTRSFDVFFDLRPNNRLSKHWRRLWFETPAPLLWRHCNDMSRNDIDHARQTREKFNYLRNLSVEKW